MDPDLLARFEQTRPAQDGFGGGTEGLGAIAGTTNVPCGALTTWWVHPNEVLAECGWTEPVLWVWSGGSYTGHYPHYNRIDLNGFQVPVHRGRISGTEDYELVNGNPWIFACYDWGTFTIQYCDSPHTFTFPDTHYAQHNATHYGNRQRSHWNRGFIYDYKGEYVAIFLRFPYDFEILSPWADCYYNHPTRANGCFFEDY